VILISLMLMGSIAWFIWLRQREGLYGLFALSSFWGAVSTLDHLMQDTLLPWPLLGIVSAIALAWHVIFMTRFTLGIVGRAESWVRLSSLTIMIAIGIAYVLAEPGYWTIAFGFLCLPLVAAVYHSAQAARTLRSLEAMALFTVSLLVASAALRDLFVVYLPDSGFDDFALLPHTLFLFVLLMAWILVRRYTEQHRLYHELNVTLEQRVAEREAQLANSFATLQTEGEERAKLLERQRIMQDIHDGVGGQLVGLVNMVKRGQQTGGAVDAKQLQEHAQLALDELRIAVDALQPVDGDLTAVLATLRYRLEPRLKAAGLALLWNVDELPAMQDLTPRKVLQIQKIVLEALTNVMLHAKAKTVTLSAKSNQAFIDIGIADDGVGFDEADLYAAGHGLANMRFRAEAIGAELSFARGLPQGTLLKLQIRA
jgi:hypothetical protein